ncbi:fatty-acid-binding protein 3, chloroplastic-like [Miscanthus floridulus]|uniref:fatty-acid-binding protein 3, chloroplastic-like n=1 Tax=Miscanthus floridulus TaxID=154761 RepID=UPI003457B744
MMNLASVVPCAQAFPALLTPAAGSHTHCRVHTHAAASKSGLACRVARSGGGGARWLPVSCAAGGGAVGDAFVTEDTTNVKFLRELTVPGYTYPLVAVGTGYRDKFFVKVYAAAFYVDYSLRLDTEQWKEKIGIESFDGSSVFDSIFKAPVVKSLSIILVRAVDGKTFVNALNDVIVRQIKNPNAEEESSLSTLQNTFLGRNLKQGTSIYLTWLEPKRMLISISENQDPRQIDAEIESATVNYALYDGFFGKSPVSPSLRSSTAQLLEALLL